MSQINFTPRNAEQILKLPEEPTAINVSDVGFATYAKDANGNVIKSSSGDPVDAVLLDASIFENQKGVPVLRLLFGVVSGKSYDGNDVTGLTFAGDKTLSDAALAYTINDLVVMGLVNPTDADPLPGFAEKLFNDAEKAKILCAKMYRVSVEESTFKGNVQRKLSYIAQPAVKLDKAGVMAKLKGSLATALANSKAGKKSEPKVGTSPPPANQRPAAGDPFAIGAPAAVDPGAGDLGEL